MGTADVDAAPVRPARWLLGEGIGVQVWEIDAHPDQRAALLVGLGGPLVLLNRSIVGTPLEWGALAWALHRAAEAPAPGLYLWLA